MVSKRKTKRRIISREQLETLVHKLDNEGFHYGLTSYSSWGEIQDNEFHKLRNALVDATTELEDWLQKKKEKFDIEEW